MSDILGRLAGMGKLAPEMCLQLLGMVIDAVGQGEEWAGDELAQLGRMTEQLATVVKGAQARQGGGAA